MTMQEVNAKLAAEFPKEMDSAVEYHSAALAAKNAGKEMEYVYLFKIAQDEMTHAKFIHDYMIENGLHIPPDQAQRYKELEAAHNF